MTPDKIAVVVIGLAIIVLILWYFFGKEKGRGVRAKGRVAVAVKGGYSPETIEVEVGKTITLVFTRTDPSSCLDEVIFPDFGVSKKLPLNESVEVAITPQKTGEYPFTCGMRMFKGVLVAV